MNTIDETNDPKLRSWMDVPKNSDFPIQNIPFGVCKPKGTGEPRVCSAIGEYIVDLAILEKEGLLPTKGLFNCNSLNPFMKEGRKTWREVRKTLSHLLSKDVGTLRDNSSLRNAALIPQSDVEMLLPVNIGDYTDFYSSKEHATNVGTMFRGKENALCPNWLHLPVAYHGRASSIVVSGAPIHRPLGQTKADDSESPTFGACKLLDFELEVGCFIGPGNEQGTSVSVHDAEEQIFGLCLVNDWSARDIQKWEYIPLGPFLSKSFATSISPWIVTLDALKPFRCEGPRQDPEPLPYLQSEGPGAYDINLQVFLKSSTMNNEHMITHSNYKNLYWDMRQHVAHHTVSGCNLRTGDLLASGTVSGKDPGSLGCMLELTWRGENPIELPNGESRKFLHDGDEVIMRAYCQTQDYRIGFGEVTGTVHPNRNSADQDKVSDKQLAAL